MALSTTNCAVREQKPQSVGHSYPTDYPVENGKNGTTPHSHPSRKALAVRALNLATRCVVTPKSGVLSHRRSLATHIHRYYDYYLLNNRNKRLSTNVKTILSKIEVAIGKTHERFSRWITMSPGKRPSPGILPMSKIVAPAIKNIAPKRSKCLPISSILFESILAKVCKPSQG